MDHLNINHQKMTGLKTGHDLVKLFYVDLLGLSLDPRKIENIEKGRKTLWVNVGINQFHLPEAETAQVFDGVITLAFKDKSTLETVLTKLQNPSLTSQLDKTKFKWSSGGSGEDGAMVCDPWGSTFRLVVDPAAEDVRGRQPVCNHNTLFPLSHKNTLPSPLTLTHRTCPACHHNTFSLLPSLTRIHLTHTHTSLMRCQFSSHTKPTSRILKYVHPSLFHSLPFILSFSCDRGHHLALVL